MCFKNSRTLFVRAAVLSLALGVSVFTVAQDASQSGSSAGSDQAASSKSKKSKASSGTTKSGAGSSDTQPGSDSSSSSLAAADKKFVMDAARGGLAEVQLGQLAASKGTSDQVKQFGQKMVDDHSKANDELKALAQQKGVTLPTEMKPTDKAFHDKLDKMSGAAFDKAYMQHMVMDHKKDVAEFKKQSQSGKDSDLKDWAGKTLPTLEGHLDMAQKASAQLGGSNASKSQSASQ